MKRVSKSKSDKSQKFEDVALALFELLQSVGPTKITHSLVAKKAQVSRAWLYKYVGAKRDDLIHMAIRHLGKKLTERDLGDVVQSKDQLAASIVAGMNRMFENTRDFPWFIPVYFKFRGSQTPIGRTMSEIEQDYIARQAKHFEKIFKYAPAQALVAAEILTSFRMGLAFSWQHGELSRKTDQTQVLKAIEHWMNELFRA